MKRRLESTSPTRPGSGSEPDVPRLKRMTVDAAVTASAGTVTSAGASAINRFGFGFRPPAALALVSKSSKSMAASTSSTTSTVSSNQSEAEQLEPEVSRPAQTEEVSIQEKPTRGRGRLATREKALPRAATRKSASQIKADATSTSAATVATTARRNGATNARRSSARTTSALPAPTPVALVGKENNLPKQLPPGNSNNNNNNGGTTNNMAAVIETLVNTHFGPDRMSELEKVVQLRLRAKKFDLKGRQEELQSHNRQMKAIIRTLHASVKTFETECKEQTSKVQADLVGQESRLRRFHASLSEKDFELARLHQEIHGLRHENELADKRTAALTEQNKHLLEEQKQAGRVRTELESTLQRAQSQLQRAQKEIDELSLEIRTLKAAQSDREQLQEENSKRLHDFYLKQNQDEEKRIKADNEKLQARLSDLREELAVAKQEKESYRRQMATADDSLRSERERIASLERDKCKLEMLQQSVEERVAAHAVEVAELKAKVQHKDEEISRFMHTMTAIQSNSTASTTKVEQEKKELAEKVEQLHAMIRDTERNEATNAARVREMRAQVDAYEKEKAEWLRKEQKYQAEIKNHERQLQDTGRQTSVEIGVRQMLEAQMRELRTEHIAVNAQMEAVKVEMKQLQSTNNNAKEDWQAQLSAMEERAKADQAALQRRIDQLQEEKVSVESEVKTLRERAVNIRDEDLEELCDVKREVEVLRLRLKETSNQGMQSMAQKDRLIQELQDKVHQGEKTRRLLHNTIQELRGNVRVFARTRPFLPSDGYKSGELNSLVPVVSCEYDGQTMRLQRQARGGGSSGELGTHAFTFDKAFPPSAGQDTVFEEVSEFVQSSIDGYHVCLFSYGQTGSGKTHTMQGSGNGQMRGIIPRAIEKVLSECAKLQQQGWRYTLKVSFLEIYNETIKDLLARKQDASKVLSIKKDPKGGVYVPDLTLAPVERMEEVEVLMERANRARSVACTDMNAQSSRSHSVFTLHLCGVNDGNGITLEGQLNLVDLAGSERASRSNVSGERLKETQAINKSLSCLADVFNSIGNKSSHIPFRNSKLTYLLQSSLSGDGKTLMMVNVSPTEESSGETLCSLRFAQQVNKCELGKPKRQIKTKKDM